MLNIKTNKKIQLVCEEEILVEFRKRKCISTICGYMQTNLLAFTHLNVTENYEI